LRLRFDQAVDRGVRYFGCHWNTPVIARELAGNQIRWRTRDQLLDGLEMDALSTLFHIAGREALESALAERKGVILLGNHFGAHLMPAHWLVRQGHELRLFMERPHHISKFLGKHFDTDGPYGQKDLFLSRRSDTAESARAILRAARVLKAGMCVLMAGDVRWTGPHTAPARFLGRKYLFSATWVLLAAMTGAPVVSVFCRMDEDGSYHIEFLPAFRVPSDTAEAGRTGVYVQECLDRIEARVRESPANSNDYFFWDEPETAGRSQ
jgi:KDO2-lipid IV(A) lauroyltransferase